MPQHPDIDLDKIDIPDQARKFFDEAELIHLGENIKDFGLLNPLLVTANDTRYQLVAGERRVRAMRLVGLKKAPAIVLKSMDAGDASVVTFIENEFRADLRPYERAVALRDIKQKKGWKKTELAEHLHMDPSLPGKYLSLFETVQAVQEAAAADKIGVKAWYSISLLPEAEQGGLLEMFLAGMSTSQVADHSRKTRQAASKGATVKVSRIKCPVPGNG